MIRNLGVSVIALWSLGCSLRFDANEKNQCATSADCLDGLRCDFTTHTCQDTIPDGGGGMSDCDADCDASSGGTWTTIGSRLSPHRRDVASVAMPDGSIYVIGGRRWSDTLQRWAVVGSDLVEAYHPQTDTWTPHASLPTARYGHTAALGSDGWIYVIGGWASADDHTPSIVVERYDPATDTWETAPSLPVGRFGAAAVAGSDGRLQVTGGYGPEPSVTLDTVVTLAPGDTTWTTLPDRMSTARAEHVAVVAPDGRTIVIGGVTTDTSTGPPVVVDTTTAEAFLPGTPWSSLPNVGWKHTEAAATIVDDVIYVVAGPYVETVHTPSTEYHSRVSAFDLASWTWNTAAYLLPDGTNTRALVGHSAVAHDGRLYVIGGHMKKDYLYTEGDMPVEDIFVYTPPP